MGQFLKILGLLLAALAMETILAGIGEYFGASLGVS